MKRADVRWLPVVAAVLAAVAPMAASAASAPVPLTIDRLRSYFVAVTGRAGVLGFVGDRHGVLADDWQIDVTWDPQRPEDSSVRVTVPTDRLEVDTGRARRRARLGRGPGEKDLPAIRERMLGEDQLNAARYPSIEFRSRSVRATDEGFEIEGDLTLVGVTRPVTVPVRLRRMRHFTIFEGVFAIRQRDFGIEPVSVGGVIKVADEVRIRFELWTTPGGEG